MLTRADDFDNIIVAAVLALLFFCAEYSLERYRSGHNEAVLKTVCPKGRVGSNPTLSAQTFQTILQWLFILAFNSSMVLWRSTQVVEETPLERVQVVNSGARVQIPPSPLDRKIRKFLDNSILMHP